MIALMVVEGEPGIFPDPIARVLRAIGRIVRRERPPEPREPAPEVDEPEAP